MRGVSDRNGEEKQRRGTEEILLNFENLPEVDSEKKCEDI
jgi:hypothetical protein